MTNPERTMPAESEPGPEEALFAAALQWESTTERSAYLDEACAGNPGLRQRVEELLRASDEAATFPERPAADLTSPN